MQYIDKKEINYDLIKQIKEALQIKTDKEFSEKFNLHKSDLSEWKKESSKREIPKHFQTALFYIDIVIKQEQTIKRLQEQLQTQTINDSNVSKAIDELNTKFEQLEQAIKPLLKKN